AVIEGMRGWLGRPSHRSEAAATGREPFLRRLARMAYRGTIGRVAWPDYQWHWHGAALRRSRKLCAIGDISAIVSVSHPFTPHRVGLALKRAQPGLRWLVDIGDPLFIPSAAI